MNRIKFLLVALCALMFGVPAQAQQQNLIANGGFDPNPPFTDVAVPWVAWNASSIAVDFYAEVFGSVRSGQTAQALLSYGAPYTAGVYQQVNVGAAGVPLTAGVWAKVFVPPNNDLAGSRVRIGIDPSGGTNPFAANIAWSGEFGPTEYALFTTQAVSAGPFITVFLYATQNGGAAEHRQFFDDAYLIRTDSAAVAPVGSAPVVSAPTGNVAIPNVQVNVRSGPGTNFPRIGRARGHMAHHQL
jgi:hypothetical protein